MEQSRNIRLKTKYGEAYKWLAGGSVVLGLLTTIFSSTMVNVALTDIMATFTIPQASAQWMSTAFLCASSVAMLSTAWLMRAIGPRQTFLLAIGCFIVGSLMGWTAANFEILVLARILQGAATGIIQPLAMSLVFMLFPPEMRGRAMGMFGMGVVIGPAVGPIIGGIITDSFNWHMTFALVLPLAAIAGFLGWFLLPDKNDNESPGRFNLTSFVLVALAVGNLLTGLSASQFNPLTDPTVYPYLLIAVVTFILFIVRELKSPAPLVQLIMFRNPRIASAAIIGALTSAGMFSSFYAIPLFVRTVQLADATTAGLTLLPAGIILVFVFPIVGRLIDKMPAYKLILSGQILFILGTFALTFANQDTTYLFLAGWIIIGRIGLGIVMPSNSTYSLSTVSAKQVPQASGAFNFVRMLGGTIGVNLTALLITARSSHYHQEAVLSSGSDKLTQALQVDVMTSTFQDCFLITGLVFSLAIIPSLVIARATIKDAPAKISV